MFYEGFLAIQKIYKKNLLKIPISIQWLFENVVLKESPHLPFFYQLDFSNIREKDDENDTFVKQLLCSCK